MEKVLLDTNFLLLPMQLRVDIYKIPHIFTLSSCISELEKLSHGKSKAAADARTALMLVKKKNLNVIETEITGDSAILAYAKEHKVAVATNDKELIKILKEQDIKVFRIRQKKFIVEG